MLGIWYDNKSKNTGDLAVGISLKKILGKLNLNFDELSFFNDIKKYETVIIGGGLLLRDKRDIFFNKFRVEGNHILNCVGIYKTPSDLNYLDNYKYITVRSNGDKEKLHYLKKDVKVVPCTTMLLEDEHKFDVEKDAVGIHLLTNFLNKGKEDKFCRWANSLRRKIYFIPIIPSSISEYSYMLGISGRIKNSTVVPLMSPMEIFSFIGKMSFMISCSLHGGIFAYIHNVPFMLYDKSSYNDDDKMKFFMQDRGLQDDLFYRVEDFVNLFKKRDYSSLIINDKKVLEEHAYNLKCLLC